MFFYYIYSKFIYNYLTIVCQAYIFLLRNFVVSIFSDFCYTLSRPIMFALNKNKHMYSISEKVKYCNQWIVVFEEQPARSHLYTTFASFYYSITVIFSSLLSSLYSILTPSPIVHCELCIAYRISCIVHNGIWRMAYRVSSKENAVRYEMGTTSLAAQSTLLNAIYRKLLWNGAIKGSRSELLPTVKIRWLLQ